MHNASDPVQELVYSVSHDFGRPIRQIVALTDLLYEQIGDQSDNEAAELFSYLKRAGQEAQEMLARLLIYSRMAGQAPQIEAHPIDEICRECTSAYPDADFKITGTASFSTDRELLARALAELIDNACTYGTEPFEVNVRGNSDGLQIDVTDAGTGIAPDRVAAAQRPFGRLHAEDPAHVGLGLNIADRALHQLGGTLTMEQTETGFCVTATLECRDA